MKHLLTPAQLSALTVLTDTLQQHNIPFIGIGGLAAIAWGATRPLVDIDIQVAKKNMPMAEKIFHAYLQTSTRRFQNEHWDIQQMVLSLAGVGADICAAEDFYIVKGGVKHLVPNSLQNASRKIVGNLEIPVLPLDILLGYKKLLARSVDLEDVGQLRQ